MTSEERQRTPLNALSSAPSVALWSMELCDLLDGKREAFIEHLADAAEYTEDQVGRSSGESESRAHLVVALNNIVEVWTPSPYDNLDRQSLLLDLLRRYTLPSGFPKLVLFVELQNVHPASSPEYQRVVSLQRKALYAMENYFPTAPALPKGSPTPYDDAFRQYVKLLKNLRGQPEHAAYALRTLLKIGADALDGDEVVRALTRYPRAIRGILQFILEPEDRAQAARDLDRLYNVCLSLKGPAEMHFRSELTSLGGEFVDSIQGPRVLLPRHSEEIVIRIREGNFTRYSRLCECFNAASLDSNIRTLLATVPEEIKEAGRGRHAPPEKDE